MEDAQIVDLYWQRDERAIEETGIKYGKLCQSLAMNLLGSREDAMECVNDALHAAWRSIPPQRPQKLGAWVAQVVRNMAINCWQKQHAAKRGGMEWLVEELEDCIPSRETLEDAVDASHLDVVLQGWLRTLSRQDRGMFLRRYWFGASLGETARLWGYTPAQGAQKLHRLRISLRRTLEREEIL